MTNFRSQNRVLTTKKVSKLISISKIVLTLLGVIIGGGFLLILFIFLTMGVPSIG